MAVLLPVLIPMIRTVTIPPVRLVLRSLFIVQRWGEDCFLALNPSAHHSQQPSRPPSRPRLPGSTPTRPARRLYKKKADIAVGLHDQTCGQISNIFFLSVYCRIHFQNGSGDSASHSHVAYKLHPVLMSTKTSQPHYRPNVKSRLDIHLGRSSSVDYTGRAVDWAIQMGHCAQVFCGCVSGNPNRHWNALQQERLTYG
jgi:hypothetical protein